MTRHATTLLLSGCLAMLGGCGDAAAPVTYVHYMTLHVEEGVGLIVQCHVVHVGHRRGRVTAAAKHCEAAAQ